ncbi:DUF4203 domain-containing protein [Miniimonas arenae]|uniref:DUF4203 domain-containing protein n=1 Tax=Miniimonas arenae TaxID=676201 RepID=A0A5C5BCZ5_9MICO|nr:MULTISPECIES: DUF4203 domain-containing protein [Miniimonas]TNU73940.1 DUF4203 domain-containing protein [Miniimonas arenae]
MSEIWVVGILSVLVGLFMCFRGYVALRVVIAVVGAFAGFLLGAAIVAEVTPDGFLGTTLAWIGAIVGALLLGGLAYAFYQVAVVLGMASIGFAIGSGLSAALGVRPDWLVWVIGAVAAALLVVVSLATDLPAFLLVWLTAFGGANTAVTGVMLLVGVVTLDDVTSGALPDDLGWWWAVGALVLGVVGVVVQWRALTASRQAMREAWAGRTPAGRR